MLELQAITKDYRSVTECVHALRGVSLRFRDNEFVSILGPSGCGKTTLLNLILSIIDADSGSIRYNGQDITYTPMGKRGFKAIPHNWTRAICE